MHVESHRITGMLLRNEYPLNLIQNQISGFFNNNKT